LRLLSSSNGECPPKLANCGDTDVSGIGETHSLCSELGPRITQERSAGHDDDRDLFRFQIALRLFRIACAAASRARAMQLSRDQRTNFFHAVFDALWQAQEDIAKATSDADARGVFGVPRFVCGDEIF
jgi:2-hydroxychromene-2-carboxylate isomerase